jgi:hypothetical protein
MDAKDAGVIVPMGAVNSARGRRGRNAASCPLAVFERCGLACCAGRFIGAADFVPISYSAIYACADDRVRRMQCR